MGFRTITHLEGALTQCCGDDRRGTVTAISAVKTTDLHMWWEQSGFTAHTIVRVKSHYMGGQKHCTCSNADPMFSTEIAKYKHGLLCVLLIETSVKSVYLSHMLIFFLNLFLTPSFNAGEKKCFLLIK